ncbi:D-erythrulose kinase [Rhodococcus erythropolis]|uniref:D-erythrulose kinase n=1 Tax=Rhodococcus erythropolis TaxID=1833 RepID=A0A5N5E3W0_RHOER|nr:dihydroxyacetone kinase family protein [Rhodococcus sp. MS13]KAB2584300.1 D-erythrulose kinase [Rhodococcus erythropolis]NRH33666.1 dihydroxyacetone kinase family protein [Rhodococcus sp. MS13]
MTRLFNDPATFTEDMLEGFLDANSDYVVGVPGGVVRAQETRPGKVAVVVGGGSGHYPAFCGVVGPGFADGAVVGNIFTSPSAAEATSVARAVDSGAGVLLTTGNYAGDVMNFSLAVKALAHEGIDARYLPVTDDIASASAEDITKRRGIAGDFTVFKIASAAAEAGYDLDEVQRVGRAANDNTRTLGVAFDGCTMPGADHPLFAVETGMMDLGLGIHGEPGVSTHEMPSAAELAKLLVDGVLAERPDGSGTRVAVILNGLGRTKYEELFVVWGTAAKLLREAGYTVVSPEVGELVTSLDMAGCSLTLMWLDEELESFWTAAADTPAFRRGTFGVATRSGERRTTTSVQETSGVSAAGDDRGRLCGETVATVIDALARVMAVNEEELGRIDAVAGDGDHGRGMVRGTEYATLAAQAAAAQGAGPQGVLTAAGEAWAAKAGGTSGVLWGAALTAMGTRLGDKGQPGAHDLADGVRAGYDAIVALGGAKLGDKTMLDALWPFVETLSAAVGNGVLTAQAWDEAADVAQTAADATAQLRPLVGRARPLAERSVGTPDAGAISMAMCVRTVADFLNTNSERKEHDHG